MSTRQPARGTTSQPATGSTSQPAEIPTTEVFPELEQEVQPPATSNATAVSVEGSQEQAAIRVRQDRANIAATSDQSFWAVISSISNNIDADSYVTFLEPIMCGQLNEAVEAKRNTLPFPGVSAYGLLKAATEVFILMNAGLSSQSEDARWAQIAGDRGAISRLAYPARVQQLRFEWEKNYLQPEPGGPELPYLAIIRAKLGLPLVSDQSLGFDCYGLLQSRVNNPIMIELIWSYWHEEAMLAQTMNAISVRFQNRQSKARVDPLFKLNIDPLRPLSSIMWGWVQDEQHRLTVSRRAHEYAHQYGLTLEGKAVESIHPAEKRLQFIEGFHTLLHECMKFFAVDDDTTKVANAFPILKHLKIMDRRVSESSHNQYGDLGWVARVEMLMMIWIMARPEMREYLGGRGMIAYPEPWMEQVEAMKTLQKWTCTDVSYFRDLALFGERLVLTFRYGAWTPVIYAENAANWARYWRPEIEGYVDAYQIVTGVDLRPPATTAEQRALRNAPPSVHLARRLREQHDESGAIRAAACPEKT
jgi:hypothetical protein